MNHIKHTWIWVIMLCLPWMAHAKTYEIKMLNQRGSNMMVFAPSFIAIEPGDEVTFIPTDLGHTSQSLIGPSGFKGWASKMDEKITVPFTQEGVYIYECSNHSIMGMVGVIQVGKPINMQEAQQFAKTHAAKLISHKERLGQYLDQIKQPEPGTLQK